MKPARETWGTRVGVILAVTGSAVGLGNFLRFPGKAAQYEGGAFMIPYFIALFLLGLSRRTSVSVLGFITACGTAFIVYFSKNAIALDTFDFWAGSACIYVLATIQVILFGWVLGIEKGFKEIDHDDSVAVTESHSDDGSIASRRYVRNVFIRFIVCHLAACRVYAAEISSGIESQSLPLVIDV
jgi:SNF family Na+-dependent transporter